MSHKTQDKEIFIGIDYFRVIAAILVVAIHISPLATYNETADFILTRIIARVAVPFFFMASGFFLISKYDHRLDKLKKFISKTAILYGAAIVFYLPINSYNGYFLKEPLLPNMIKDILFDGTFYHLWYLPAAIIGATISWLLVKKFGLLKAFFMTAVLYSIGLFGDSYFGFSQNIPLLNGLYKNLFEISDYTRNGIFFAPIFFILGGMISNAQNRPSLKMSLIGLALSFTAMLTEGLLLNQWGVQRHDSMYLMLIPVMFFLFTAITYWKGKKNNTIRLTALIIYLVHPMMIIVVRGVAKVLGLQAILVDNSLVHFIVVATSSAILALVFATLIPRVKPHSKPIIGDATDRSWIELNLDHLLHNASALQEVMPPACDIMAVVKANGYGHGAIEVSKCLNSIGITSFAVATIDEGIQLRKNGIQGEILILNYTDPVRAKALHNYDLMQTLIDYNYSVALNNQGYRIKVHMKIDTGMHRLGFSQNEIEPIKMIFKAKNLHICGIYTHLCVSDSMDSSDVAFTKTQITGFYTLLDNLSKEGIIVPKTHIQSSYGLLNYPELKCDYVRIGIALYGTLSSVHDKTNVQIDLRPVLSIKSQVILIRAVTKGESVGYGRQFVADRDSQIAVLPIGYADGLSRNLSHSNSHVLLNGKQAPIVGRICMDQLIVDITDIPEIQIGDIATVIGKDGQTEILATEIADNSGSITNEVLSRIGSRLKLVVK